MAFVGRERELAQLAEAVRRVAEGRLGRVVLTGPAGIGCTRLLDELSTRVSSVPGVVACRGRAYEPAMGRPYQALAQALSMAFDELTDERLVEVAANSGHDLASLIPELRERLDALGVERTIPRLIAPEQRGRRVLESILGTLERLAGSGVLLLVLEDVHFADPATRGLIDALQGVGRNLPVCLVLTYQPNELHRRHPVQALADRLADDPEVVRMELGPMAAAELEQVVADAAGDRPPANVVAAVAEGARGNPLIALQLAQSAETLEGVRLSDPFDQLCGARLEALPRDGARVVRVMAAARAPLMRSTLLAVHAPEGRLTVKGLDEALQSGFVVKQGDQISASHELCAEAIEALELTPERQALHAAIALQLQDAPALAAWHWSRAARPTEAREAHIRAATMALQLDPAVTVLEHFEEALELPGTEQVSPEERSALLAGAAAASASAGSFRRAVALQRRAIESRATRGTAPKRGHRDASTRLALGEMYAELGHYQSGGGDPAGALESMERSLGIMPEEPSRVRARAQALLAQHLMIGGRFKESASIAEDARATALAAAEADEGTLAELGHATCTLGVDAAYLGEQDRGLALLEEASELARSAGRLDDLMRASANRTMLLDLDSRREDALAVILPSIEAAAESGLEQTYGAFLRGNAADILYSLGRWTEAERECRIAMEWRMSALEAEWWPPLVLGLLLAESRADEEATKLVGQALLQLETVPSGQWTGYVLRSAVSLALWSGDAAGALAVAEREWPRALATGELGVTAPAASTCMEAAASAADHGRASSDAGLIARARALSEQILPQVERAVERSSLAPSLGSRQEAELSLASARAHAGRVRGKSDPAAWERLAVGWAARPMPYRAAKARWWQALAIMAAADEEDRESARAQAREPLAEAYRMASDLPALPLLREVVDLAARARVALPIEASEVASAGTARMVAVGPGTATPVAVGPGRPRAAKPLGGSDIAKAIEERILASLRKGSTDAYGLSPREREVLNIVAEGRTDRDIAARLFISERTVHVHVRRILAKLGVSSRTEAASLAIRQGLVPMEAATAPTGSSAVNDVASRS
jgi:DNA-binding CsgD family transcriptional regulator